MNGFPQLPPEQLAQMAKEDVTHKVIVLVATFTTFGFVCVCLRFFSRIKMLGLIGLEDFLIAFSMIMSAITSACLIETARWGNGRHFLNLPPANGKMILKWLYFSIISYHLSLTSTKISILWQYRRVFTYKQMRLAIYIAMAFCFTCGFIGIVCAIFTCIPLDAYWDFAKRPFARCVNQDAMYHANAGLNISTDLLVAALPVRAIWKLQIAVRQKVALLFILTIGWFVVVVSIIRLYVLILVANHPMDTSWYGGPTAYWSAIEVNLAIVCASLPALRPLVIAVIPAFASRIGTKRSHDNSNSKSNPLSQESKESRSTRTFIRLKGRNSQSTVGGGEEIDMERGVASLPGAARYHGQIHVQQDFEAVSNYERKMSDGSQRGLFPKPAPVMERW